MSFSLCFSPSLFFFKKSVFQILKWTNECLKNKKNDFSTVTFKLILWGNRIVIDALHLCNSRKIVFLQIRACFSDGSFPPSICIVTCLEIKVFAVDEQCPLFGYVVIVFTVGFIRHPLLFLYVFPDCIAFLKCYFYKDSSVWRILKDREKYLHITTSRVGDHRLSTYLLVAFNTDKATCHQGDGANIVAFSIAICQSWFLRVCWSTFIEWVGQNWTNTLLGKFMAWGSILVWSAISPKYVARLASIWACRLTAPCLPESRKAEAGTGTKMLLVPPTQGSLWPFHCISLCVLVYSWGWPSFRYIAVTAVDQPTSQNV